MTRKAEPATASQQGAARPNRLKRSAVQIETPVQRYTVSSYSQVLFPGGILTLVLFQEEERSPDCIRRGCQSILRSPGSKARSRNGGEHEARVGCSSDRGCRQVICHQFRGGECHESQASPDSSSRRMFLPRGIGCLQFGRRVPPCR